MEKKETGVVDSQYPAAELLQEACRDDYLRLINTYDQIYNKVNMAIVFCGVILIVIINSFDTRIISKIINDQGSPITTLHVLLLVASAVSIIFISWAAVDCLLHIKSREIVVFDSRAIRTEEIYRGKAEEAALWLINNYTIAINSLKETIDEKQKKFDATIKKIVIALIAYIVYVLMSKGV